MTMRQLRILVAPSPFDNKLRPEKIADCIEEGIRRVLPEKSAFIHKVPLYNGGDHFSQTLLSFYGGEIRNISINSPFYSPIQSHLGFIDGGNTAVLDVAAAAGRQFIVEGLPDPTATTSYGIGELFTAALDSGCKKIIFDCNDSIAVDGGAGMLQALGARLLDAYCRDIVTIGGGSELSRLEAIDMSHIHPRLHDQDIRIEVLYYTDIELCGYAGVAERVGRASFEQTARLESALEQYARVARKILREDVGHKPGSGVCGGLGTALMLLGAQFRSRFNSGHEYFDLETLFDKQWDLVITGVGLSPSQFPSMARKLAKLARRKHGMHVIAVVGTIEHERTADLDDEEVSSYMAIPGSPTDELIRDAAKGAMRMVQIGISLNQGETESQVPGIKPWTAQLDVVIE
ncbi:glycerate kinase [Hypoxylon sp. FL1857]|nr:glycerate kinase [Hypoxylon sp. FL1857]